MTVQQYLQIENNLVTNTVMWDGNTEQWQPPTDAIMLVDADTVTMIWQPVVVDKVITDYALGGKLGAGDIGFTWNGTNCITNEPKPEIPVQPVTTGTVTA